MAALLITEPQSENPRANWNDSRISYFDSPILLIQKFLCSNTVRLLTAEYKLTRSMLLTGLTDIWLYALDRFAANSSSTHLGFWMSAVNRTQSRFSERVDFDMSIFRYT